MVENGYPIGTYYMTGDNGIPGSHVNHKLVTAGKVVAVSDNVVTVNFGKMGASFGNSGDVVRDVFIAKNSVGTVSTNGGQEFFGCITSLQPTGDHRAGVMVYVDVSADYGLDPESLRTNAASLNDAVLRIFDLANNSVTSVKASLIWSHYQ